MSNTPETTVSKHQETDAYIVSLNEVLAPDEFDESNLEITHEQTIYEVQAFANAIKQLREIKERLSIDSLDKQQVATIIDRMKAQLASEMDGQREQERKDVLDAMQNVYDRIDNEVSDEYETVAREYIDQAESLPQSEDKPLLLKDAPHKFVTARMDLLAATDQIHNDTEALKLLYAHRADQAQIRYSSDR